MTLTENLARALSSAVRALATARRRLRYERTQSEAWKRDAENARRDQASAEKALERATEKAAKLEAERSRIDAQYLGEVRRRGFDEGQAAAAEEVVKLRRMVNELMIERDSLRAKQRKR